MYAKKKEKKKKDLKYCTRQFVIQYNKRGHGKTSEEKKNRCTIFLPQSAFVCDVFVCTRTSDHGVRQKENNGTVTVFGVKTY